MKDGLLKRTDPGSDVYANLSHGLNRQVMEQLRALLLEISDRTLHLRPPSIVGSVIGTYIGPGAVGLCFIQEKSLPRFQLGGAGLQVWAASADDA